LDSLNLVRLSLSD